MADVRVVRLGSRRGARDILVCLAFCGGGTGAYRPWASRVGVDTELALVCYPGREGRYAEAVPTSWEPLAADATECVLSVVDRPFTLFGHSMGGWVAFDVATRLEDRGGPVPGRLVVSSCNAAHRGVTERDRFPTFADSDDALLDWMRVTGSLPSYALDDPDLRRMAIDLMRADIRVRDSYRPRPGTRTATPLRVLYGREDPVVEPVVAEQWSSIATGPVEVTELPGGHFYTPDVWSRLPSYFTAPTAS